MNDEEKFEFEIFQTAVHEAGHVLVAWKLGLDVESAALSIDDETSGRTLIVPSKRLNDRDNIYSIVENCRSVEKRVRICYAGPIAERRFAGDRLNVFAANKDFERGLFMLRECGDTHAERERISDFLHARTEKLIQRNWEKIMMLAKELVAQGEICSAQIELILGPQSMEFECAARLNPSNQRAG